MTFGRAVIFHPYVGTSIRFNKVATGEFITIFQANQVFALPTNVQASLIRAFVPYDDPATPNKDESLETVDQQLTPVGNGGNFGPGAVYMVYYKAK